ncbi:nitrous oxide-stimulated promoter family protein [Slackia heliotrinireducens]|uniref:nitrous oxide-stimulated promoter family protein n=1 Tax=Slackia heliotrinireducens TaxID=84110 RepID=UPI003314C7EB
MEERKDRDRRTLCAIGRIYCNGNHGHVERDCDGLCPECRATVEATARRAEACPFGHEGNCQDCPVHCQRGEDQVRVKRMMRYAAPRMALLHPLMTWEYLHKRRRRT